MKAEVWIMPTLGELLRQLPVCKEYPTPSITGGVRFIKKNIPYFVSPDLNEKTSGAGEAGLSVLLISAPAAVGKTTVGKYIAHETKAPLWDLSKFRVGTGTFLGTLTKVFGNNYNKVLDETRSGSFLIVVDALDEGELRVGSPSFIDFLNETLDFYKTPGTSPGLILLTRTYTAETVEICLIEKGIGYKHYSIDYFTESEAKEFVDKYYDMNHPSRPGRYENARDLLFEKITGIIDPAKHNGWDSIEVRSFLGYAPVLVAVASYLDYNNYQNFINEIEAKDFENAWVFLAEIIDKLLERERTDKVLIQIKPELELLAKKVPWSDWEKLYNIKEQCNRVASLFFKIDIPEKGFIDLPTVLSKPYEQHISTFLPQHPFVGERSKLANVIFSEYLCARLLSYGEKPYSDAVRNFVTSESYLPKPLLGEFLVAFSKTSESEETLIDIKDMGILYESLLSRGLDPDDLSLDIGLGEAPGSLAGSITIRSGRDRTIPLLILGSGESLKFSRRLSFASILTPGTDVDLGLTNRSFIIGPNVLIECSGFGFFGSDLNARAGDDLGSLPVMITAEHFNTPGLNPRIIKSGNNVFSVFWPGISYPWVTYRGEENKAIDNASIITAFKHFRWMCLTWFKAHGYGALGANVARVKSSLLNRPDMASKLYDYSLAKGLFYLDGDFVRVNDSEGLLNIVELAKGEITDGIQCYLAGFLKEYV